MNALLGMAGAASGDEQLDVMDVFSAYSYLGNGGTTELKTGIDYTKGALIWTKNRGANLSHVLVDTERGADKYISTDSAASETISGTSLFTSFGSNSVQAQTNLVNTTGNSYVSWHFRKSKRFFDVVTYTGNGVEGQTIFHDLGVEPGMVLIKRTSSVDNWYVYHRSVGLSSALNLNGTSAPFTLSQAFIESTDKHFKLGGNTAVNGAGISYVAYFFAHDDLSDSIIKCGVHSGTGPVTIGTGFQPQFLITKRIDTSDNWYMYDTNRGIRDIDSDPLLYANLVNAESNADNITLFSDGFINNSGGSFIYIAIRHTNTKPKDPKKVFSVQTYIGNGTTGRYFDMGVSPDAVLFYDRNANGNSAGYNTLWLDRLSQIAYLRSTSSTTTGANFGTIVRQDYGNGVVFNSASYLNQSSISYSLYGFRRAKGFYESTLYIGNSSTQTIQHRLGIIPELAIFKTIDTTNYGWAVWCKHSTFNNGNNVLYLNSASRAVGTSFDWWGNNTSFVLPNAVNFTVGSVGPLNQAGIKYMGHFFASCPGVSKIGNYTGNGTSQTLNFGFSNGTRFFLVKCATNDGNWWIWDNARGILSSNDPTFNLNTTSAEVSTTDAVDPHINGIIVNEEPTCSINQSGQQYIYMAIA